MIENKMCSEGILQESQSRGGGNSGIVAAISKVEGRTGKQLHVSSRAILRLLTGQTWVCHTVHGPMSGFLARKINTPSWPVRNCNERCRRNGETPILVIRTDFYERLRPSLMRIPILDKWKLTWLRLDVSDLLIVLSVVLSAFLDIVNSVAQYLNSNSPVFAVVKGGILTFVLLNLRRSSSLFIAIGILCVFLARELNIVITGQEFYPLPDCTYFLRIFFFISWLLLFAEKREHASLIAICTNVFVILVSISVLCQVIGGIFHLQIFKAYGDQRLGYKGIFQAENDTSIFYLLALVYAMSLWNKGRRAFFFVVICGLVLLGAGSKTALLGAIEVPVVYLICSGWFRSPLVLKRMSIRPLPLVGWSLFTMSLALAAYSLFRYFEQVLAAIDYEQMLHIYRENGFLSSLLSFRDLKVEAYFTYLRSVPSALFGLQVPQGAQIYNMESPGELMYEIDLFDYLGRIGLIGTFITTIAITRTTGVAKWKSRTPELRTLLITIFLGGGTVGHTLISSINAVWIALWMIVFSTESSSKPSFSAASHDIELRHCSI